MSKIDGNGSPASAEWLHIGTKCCCEFAYVGSSFAVSARNLTLKNSASLVFHWPTDGTPKHGSLFSSSGLHKARPSLGVVLALRFVLVKFTKEIHFRLLLKLLAWNHRKTVFHGNQTFTWTALTRATP
ncbi:uncharacterized protein [Montipora foliosa]|uniref:uncharacterized protein isoform X6 n=1 Tax=Montipora foliosa TaxID=591990 RepID=UPI0035F1D2ED